MLAFTILIQGELHRNKNSSTEVEIKVRKLIKHPIYQYPSKLNNDIALIKLARPVKLNNDIAIACLPKPKEQVPENSKCFISGEYDLFAQVCFSIDRSSNILHG